MNALLNPKIIAQLGSIDTFTFLETSIIAQLLSLIIQYVIPSRLQSTQAAQLWYLLSVAHLIILSMRYLAGQAEERKKLRLWSFIIHLGRFSMILVFPSLVVPFAGDITNSRFVTSIMAFALGVVIEIASQTQKSVALKYNNRKLVTDGMHKYCRQPQIIGGICKYLGFLAIVGVPQIYISVLLANIYLILLEVRYRDMRLSIVQGWKEYEKATNPIIPKFSNRNVINYGMCIIFGALLMEDYRVGGYITKLNHTAAIN